MAKKATKARTAPRAKKAAKSTTARRKTATRAKTATRRKSTARTTTRRAPARRDAAAKVPAAIALAAQQLKASLTVAEFPDDAIALLQQDHRKVESLFEEFENTQSKAEKASIAAKICLELRVHMQIEEELLYPPAHKEIEHDLVDEATVEHASAKDLVHQIETMDPAAHLYDAKVKVLSEYIKHHVKEEENEMFPKLRGHNLNLHDLAARLTKRKIELIRNYAKAS
ncbi:hemerythrin domain-containing protein [Ferrovibrio terrae]|uniref:hemerythrin domain-containing protein n=1 Tax=Ferrovibrio terrae TaxID=2594003 RepID=UPI0031378467